MRRLWMKSMKKILTADFETTTDPLDCRVWAWGICEVGNPEYFEHGNTIESFFDFMEHSDNSTLYFHNLKFDSEFIMVELFKRGYKHVTDRNEESSRTFTTLISDKGQFYAMKIIFEKKNKKTSFVQIYDSLKILPFSVDQIAKAFGLPISKLKLDYTRFREYGYILNEDEIAYLRNDVDIVARALHVLFSQGLNKMTQGSNALHDYINTIGKKDFKRYFPTPDYDSDVRQSYKGGFTYLKPEYKSRDIGTGIVMDVNSLYPWVMHDCKLPYGEGIYFEGKYEQDDIYPLYVQMITCQFELKPEHIPTIQLKGNFMFCPTQYLSSSDNELVTMCLTSVDLKLFLEHYEVYNLKYHSGWKFKQTDLLFKEYIDKWTKVKIESTINGNKGMRTLAKLMLNALYGKFALNPNVRSKIPFYDNGMIRYALGQQETREPLYIPVGTFVTAYAREKTIRSAQALYKHFVYADTDSLHLDIELPPELIKMSEKEFEKLTTADLKKYGIDIPDTFDIHPTNLGAWKLESKFSRARFLRQKSYIEDSNFPETWDKEIFSTKEIEKLCEENGLNFKDEIMKYTGMYDKDLMKITCAGMPDKCYPYVTWDNFFEGNSFKGKLQPKHVEGGIVLQDIDFTIKRA